MFEARTVRREAPEGAGPAPAPLRPSEPAGPFGRADSPEAREALLERLGVMAPGGDLAMVLQDVVSHLLVPAGPGEQDPDVPDEDSPVGQGVLFPGLVDPAERVLADAAGRWWLDGSEEGGAELVVSLGAHALSELVAAAGRLQAWAAWAKAVLAGLLVRTDEMAGRASTWDRPPKRTGTAPTGPEGAGGAVGPGGCGYAFEACALNATAHLACRLGVSRERAGRLIERGQALLGGVLAPTECLHRAGLVDEAKVALITRRLDGQDYQSATEVQERVLPRAPRRTHPQLARDLERALATVDPQGACERGRRNQAARHVSRPRPAGTGVSQVRLLLPTPDAFLLDATLDAVAASARATGDERTLAQVRADALTSMTLSTLRRSHAAAAAQVSTTLATARSPVGTAASTMSAPAAAGVAGAASAVEAVPAAWGSGSWDLADGRGLLADGIPLEGLLTTLSSLVSSTSPWWRPSGHDPVLPPPGLTVRGDVTVPLDQLVTVLDEPGPASTSAPAGSSAPYGASGPCGSSGARASGPVPSSAPGQEVVLTAGGRSTPVAPAVALALAAGGTWRRLVTDPLSGTVVDGGRTSYRPPASLADLVRARDTACTHPGCQVPAARCDIDHIRPWSQGGDTSLTNLTCLCQAHHRLKHTPGWSLTRTPDGLLEWTTPTGERYQRHPDSSVHRLAQRVGPRGLTRPAARAPALLEKALDAPVLARLERGLEQAAAARARPQALALTTRGPGPGDRVGAYEKTPYHHALHTLGLAPLLDQVPPF